MARDFGLSGQMQRAAVSIMSNIAEGYERGSRSEYRHFLNIAKGSCAELRSQLSVPNDVGYITEQTFRPLLASAEEIGRIIGGLLVSLERQAPAR